VACFEFGLDRGACSCSCSCSWRPDGEALGARDVKRVPTMQAGAIDELLRFCAC